MEQQLKEMEESMKLLASTISEQGGQLQAMQATLLGICIALNPKKEIANSANAHLGMAFSSVLRDSTNAIQAESFERLMDLLKAALLSQPSSYISEPDET